MAAAGTIAGSLGTWEAHFGSSEPGTDGAGLYTACLGVISAVTLLASSRGRRRDACIVAGLFGALAFGIALVRLIELIRETGPLGTDPVDPGWGIWFTVAGGGSLALCCFALSRFPLRGAPGS